MITLRFTWIYLLKSKDQTYVLLMSFNTMVEKQFSLSIKSIQINDGVEFKPLAIAL